jgi:hypothetical protein
MQNYNFVCTLGGCEACSFTLQEEHMLIVFENRALRRISGRKRDEITGSVENYILKSFKICTLHQLMLDDQMKEDDICRACMTQGRKINAYRVSMGKPEGKSLLGRPECRQEVNTKMELYKIEWKEVDWIDLVQNRVLRTCQRNVSFRKMLEIS